MKKIIVENQSDFKILKGVKVNQKTGREFPILYLKGNYKSLHDADNLGKTFGAKWDSNATMWYWWVDKNDYQATIDNKIKPLINRINQFYKYSLVLDDLKNQLDDYVPSESKNEVVATAEEADEVKKRITDFKDNLLSIENNEEFKASLASIIDFKAAQGYPYSLSNVMLIKAQRPNATIVNARRDWESAYNRTVNEGAKPIFIWKPAKKSYGGNSKQVEKDFLASVGKSSKSELNPNELMRLKKDTLTAQGSSGGGFILVGHYDVSDTTQKPGTEDYIEKAKAASTKMNIDADNSNIVSDEVKPIYNGLVAYAESLNIGINNPAPNRPNITVPNNAGNDARITKLLAKSILSEILHKSYLKDKGGFVSKLNVGAKSPQSVAQQSEVASWMFMYAFGIDFKTTQIDIEAIFGNEKESMAIVLDTVSKAVNHLVDFVNVNISDNAKLTEDNESLPHGKHISPMDIAKVLGIQNMLKNNDTQSLQERLLKKVLRLI
jgi:hypothetical protein